jgi:hypothetical protein
MKLEDKMWNRIPVLIAAVAALIFEMSLAHAAPIMHPGAQSLM